MLGSLPDPVQALIEKAQDGGITIQPSRSESQFFKVHLLLRRYYYSTFHTHLPKPTFLLLLPINNLQRLITLRYIPRQILIPILNNKDIILDPDAPNRVVLVEELCVDVFGVLGVFEVDFFKGVAGEITAQSELINEFRVWKSRGEEGSYIPGSTVMTMPGSSSEGFLIPIEKYAVSQFIRDVCLKP